MEPPTEISPQDSSRNFRKSFSIRLVARLLSLRAVHEIVSWLTCPLGRGVMRAEEVMLQRDASWLATCRQGICHSGFSVHVVDYLTRRWQNVLLFGTLQILCAHLHTFNDIPCPGTFVETIRQNHRVFQVQTVTCCDLSVFLYYMEVNFIDSI